MTFIQKQKQKQKKRRNVDKVLQHNSILPFNKYTLIEQKYDYISTANLRLAL